MLKTSAGFKTNRAVNRGTYAPESGDFANPHDRDHADNKNIDRLLQIIGETAIVKVDLPEETAAESVVEVSPQPTLNPSQEQLAWAEIDGLLRQSGLVAQNVQCDVEESAIILSGRVRRYHHLQIVLQIAMRCRAGRQIVNKIGIEV